MQMQAKRVRPGVPYLLASLTMNEYSAYKDPMVTYGLLEFLTPSNFPPKSLVRWTFDRKCRRSK